MEVTSELKDNLKAAIVLCLDTYAADKDIDEQMLASVIEVIKEIPEPKQIDQERTAVKYVGKRPEYTDGIYETGIWKKDQEKLVPIATAVKMFQHIDVYVKGTGIGLIEYIQEDDGKSSEKEEDLHNIRNEIFAMTKPAAVRKFVADNFQGLDIDLPKNTVLSKVQEKAIQLIDQYGLPGMP